MDVIILAAGLGTRIQSVNSKVSKCLITVNGESLLQRKLRMITDYKGVEHLYIVIHKEESEIQKMIGDSYAGVPISYVRQKMENGGIINGIFDVLDEKQIDCESDILIGLGDEYFENLKIDRLMDSFSLTNQEIFAVCISTDDIEKIKNNYSVDVTLDMEIKNAIEKPVEVCNKLIGTGILVLQASYLMQFKKEVLKGNVQGKELVDLLNEARKFGYLPKAYVLETKYYNINKCEDLNEVSKNLADYQDYQYIIDLFQDTAKKYGDRVAVIQEEKKITFRELDELSDKLCSSMEQQFCLKEHGIGIMCGRTIEHLITVLAVLKAGAFYIPIDEHFPEKRIQYMLKKADCLFVVGKKELFQKINLGISMYDYEDLINGSSTQKVKYSYCNIKDKNAYVIFTSGSTGKPKGALITEKGVLNLVWGMKKEVLDRHNIDYMQIGVMASFSFDLSVQQIFSSLLLGHTLHIIPHEAKFNVRKLIQYLNQLHICDGTPMIMSMLNQHLIQNPEDKLTLKHYVSAGETLRKAIVHKYFELCPEAWVTNSYGPTECTVETTFFHMDKQIESLYNEIPIGKPIGNMRVYVLDKEKRLLPQNSEGEIWISGIGVGKGYINEKELTDKAFQKDILDSDRIMYKTGDAGYFSIEGNLCYVGRLDNQIKYKGYRIEPGEIEKVFEKNEHIRECRVLLASDANAGGLTENYLVAYIVTENMQLKVSDLLEFAKDQLPEYMFPQFFVPVEKFEMNQSGKLNKELLPDYRKCALGNGNVPGRENGLEELESDPSFQKFIHLLEQYTSKIDCYDESLLTYGLDSLRMYELLFKVSKEYKVAIDIRDFPLWSSPKEMYLKINSISQKNEEEKVSDGREYKRRKEKEVQASGLLNHLLQMEEYNALAGQFQYMNQMIYLISLRDNVDYDRLNLAYKKIQKENEAFCLKIISRGGKQKIVLTDVKLKDLIIKKECKAFFYMHNGIINAELDKEVMGCFEEDLQDITFQNEMYKVLFCTFQGKKMLLVSFHHAIFDYLSLVCFMDRLNYYYNAEEKADIEKGVYFQFLIEQNQLKKMGVPEDERQWIIEAASSITPYHKYDFFKNLEKNLETVTCTKTEMPYAKMCGSKLVGYRIKESVYKKVEKYAKENQILKAAVYEAVFYYMIRNFSHQENPSYIFYTSGRKKAEQLYSIGFYSYPVFFEGHGIQWSSKFLEFVKQFQKRKNEIEKKMVCPFYIENEKVADIISGEIIFDYQKMYSQNKDSLWSIAYPFETVSYANPFAFRVFDYGSYGEFSIICDSEYVKDNLVEQFIGAYCVLCNKLLKD